MHHPVQLAQPDWNSVFCADPLQARRSRAWVRDYIEKERALYFSSHFADTSVVRHDAAGEEEAWAFV
ncbi:hypothetical protein [Pseudoxanthomonas sp. GM95]|uniref:hypothetical protein n=1 Tax=Pseudoxanthomonas sp. GM95 TaxID=1881043 RepID=UPI000B87B783|nr:hypothetical protein [Pseudoxanthomonas sp. GM95]